MTSLGCMMGMDMIFYGVLMGFDGNFYGIYWNICLVGRLEHYFDFPYIGNVIIPIDFHIFQRV